MSYHIARKLVIFVVQVFNRNMFDLHACTTDACYKNIWIGCFLSIVTKLENDYYINENLCGDAICQCKTKMVTSHRVS